MLHTFSAIILGIVEGITEFLPISSTGHMILTINLLHIWEGDFVKSFEIIIQLGAILAVLVLYWKKLFLNFETFKKITVAFIPTAIIGLIAYRFVKTYLLGSIPVVLSSLAIGGALLVFFEMVWKNKIAKTEHLESITYKQALIIGVAQSVAIIPGVSRSAATIVGGMLLGISREAIVEFSFMLAVPTMAAATGLDLIKSGHSFTHSQIGLLAVGLMSAFISALLAVKLLLKFVQKHTFTWFGMYRIVLAALFFFVIV